MVGNDCAEQKCSDADRYRHGHAHINADAHTQADANPYAEANTAADADANAETDSHSDRNTDFCRPLVQPNNRHRALRQSKIHRNHVQRCNNGFDIAATNRRITKTQRS